MSFPRYSKYKDSGTDWLGELPEHWNVAVLKHIVSTPITDGPHETPDFRDEGIPFVSAEAVASGSIDFAKIRGFITESVHQRYCEKYRPCIGDIYMVKSGATTGVAAIVDTDVEFNIWSPLAAIRCGSNAFPRYVLHFLRSRNFQEGVTLNWSFGTQQNIGMRVIENLAVPIPPFAEQTAIASFLDRETRKIDELVAEQRLLIELLKEKRQAVISHAVTKGLNPQAPTKPSGIEWLGDVPKHWEGRKLRFLFKQTKRQGFQEKEVLSVYRDYGVILKSSRDDNMNKTPEDLSKYQLVERGDLVVNKMKSWQGSLGVSKLDGITSPDYVVFSPSHSESPDFLHHLLRSSVMVSSYLGISNGIRLAQWRLEPDHFLNLRVFLPPTDEQNRIVAFLVDNVSRFDALTAEAQRGIDLLQERRTALISAAVTGKIKVTEESPRCLNK